MDRVPMFAELRHHLRGVAVALAGSWLVVLGFPTTQGPWEPARASLARSLAWTQRPLRLAQTWSLYGVGPNHVRRFEVWADDELLYRSGEPHHPGGPVLHPLLRYRRVRPVVVGVCLRSSRHHDSFLSYVARVAWRLRPDAATVTLRCTTSEWPGDAPTVKRTWSSTGPGDPVQRP